MISYKLFFVDFFCLMHIEVFSYMSEISKNQQKIICNST